MLLQKIGAVVGLIVFSLISLGAIYYGVFLLSIEDNTTGMRILGTLDLVFGSYFLWLSVSGFYLRMKELS